MMNKVKEAVEVIRKRCYPASAEVTNALLTVLEVIESVLSVEGRMPAKKIYEGDLLTHNDYFKQGEVCGFNEAIDACTLAFAGLDRERIKNAIPDESHYLGEFVPDCECADEHIDCRVYTWCNKIDEYKEAIADAIIKAIRGDE